MEEVDVNIEIRSSKVFCAVAKDLIEQNLAESLPVEQTRFLECSAALRQGTRVDAAHPPLVVLVHHERTTTGKDTRKKTTPLDEFRVVKMTGQTVISFSLPCLR